LILLSQNRQADRDRMEMTTDRTRAESNLAQTEYLAREIADLRLQVRGLATKDFIHSELASLAGKVKRREFQ
jgi:uncharacterized membrane protein